MNTPELRDDETAELLSQTLSAEAADVETDPTALQRIQRRTAGAGAGAGALASAPARRRWVLGAFGAAAATAAVITAVVVIGDRSETSSNGTPAATQPASSTDTAPEPSQTTSVAESLVQVPVTYVGIPAAERASLLYTVQSYVATTQPPPIPAVELFLFGRPPDPDYTAGWPKDIDVAGISSDGTLTQVDLEGPAGVQFSPDPDLGPDGGELALQALFRTAGLQPGAQGTVTYNGEQVSAILGVDLPVTIQGDDQVRARVSIENLVDGQAVTNPVTVQASGMVFEGTLSWQLLDASGATVDEGYVDAGSYGKWRSAEIKLGNLSPGTYTIRCLEYSPKNGSPGFVDDKTFTVS